MRPGGPLWDCFDKSGKAGRLSLQLVHIYHKNGVHRFRHVADGGHDAFIAMYRNAIPQTLGGCVSLPAKHYRLLLEIVSAGTWMICSGDACPDPSFRNSVKDLYQQFLKLGEEQGLAQDVWCSPEDGLMHHESFEEQQGAAWKALEAYEQESFVLNFGRRLGREMAIHEIGAEAWAAIGQSERLERVAAYEERIQGMLARHGWFGLLLGSAESGG